MAKAQKEAEKRKLKELKQANALRSASKDTLHDTILCLEKTLYGSELGEAIKSQFIGKAAEIVEIEDDVQYTIRWQTKTKAEWDSLSQSFIPFENKKTTIVKNRHVALWMNMQRFTIMIQNEDLIPTLAGIKAQQAGSQVVLIVEGLQKYYRDQKNHRSRAFQNSVLKGIAEEFGEQRSRPATSKKPRTSKTDWIADGPDKNTIEDIMLSLQLSEKIMIVHTANITETASWIASFSATMATTNASSELLDFYMDVRAKSGIDSTDTWLKMLQNIQKCTDAVAKAIVQEYPTVYSLYDAYTKTQSVEEAEMLLADIEVQRSVITNRDRFVNKAMSKKIYSILMSDDNKLVIS
ncbi:hypothetical protein K450DRAFT_218654 [Umbelopsis ramanniana AG]|uniref:ERCC4 domain-containing protein n=1 Tax=Umbelopsis ramanniana AG TaxID=1314678 RepID=A0AAD5HH62_UMBRA|nr:uncharacterized protein K450DRAFT_218654 [Umbelopsis ramanniana AG]KAI8584205.1 hypothetical protein K450DRAFT_218654 [Umbelopsis ramanniana AG]